MRKLTFVFISLFAFNAVSAQNFDLSVLDKAMTLFNSGKNTEATGLFDKAIAGISKETEGSKTSFAPKIASQLGSLSGMLSGGKSNASGLQKIVNTIKTLVAANRLKNMLGGGSLLGKGSLIGSNTNLLSSGLSLLGGNKKEASQASELLSLVSKNSSKLDGNSLVAKGAEKVVKENLTSSLSLIEKLF